MALANMGFKDQIWSHFGDQNCEREKSKRREEEEEKKKKKRKKKRSQKGMELTLGMSFNMDHMEFVWNFRKVYEFQT